MLVASAHGWLWPDADASTAGPAGPLTEVDLPCRRSEWTAHFNQFRHCTSSPTPMARSDAFVRSGAAFWLNWISTHACSTQRRRHTDDAGAPGPHRRKMIGMAGWPVCRRSCHAMQGRPRSHRRPGNTACQLTTKPPKAEQSRRSGTALETGQIEVDVRLAALGQASAGDLISTLVGALADNAPAIA